MKKPVNITILGYHGFGNCGDEAILLAMKNNIKKMYENANITVLSFDPENTKTLYGINAVKRFSVLSVVKAISKTDVLIAGGGTLLQDETSTRSLLYYLSILYFAKVLKKKVMLYSNGIGPVNRESNKKLIKFVVNKIDLITLRDEFSMAELVKIGVDKPIHVTADPAFSLNSNGVNVDKIFEKEKIDTSKDLMGISIRRWKDEEDFIYKLAELSKYVLDKYDINIVLIPMQHSMDLEISTKLYNQINRENVFLLRGNYLSEEVLGIIGRLSVLISMRLHTLIFAGAQEVPLAGIIYDPKINNYLRLLDMPSLGECQNLDLDFIKNQIDDIIVNREDYLSRLHVSSKKLKHDVLLNDIYLRQLIESLDK